MVYSPDWPDEGRTAPLPKGVTQIQWDLFNKYKEDGGYLDIQPWLSAGMPSVLEEKAIKSFLDKLDIWVVHQVNTEDWTEEQAQYYEQDVIDSLSGMGDYTGMPKRLNELSSSLVNSVNNYIASIPAAKRKELEAFTKSWSDMQALEEKVSRERIQKEQEQTQTIARQRMELPLGATGTYADAIRAGDNAIRNLQIQLDASPDYLKDTIKDQIGQLQTGVDQLIQSEMAGERAKAGVMTPEQVRRTIEVEQRNEPSDAARRFGEKYTMSTKQAQLAAVEYASNPESEKFAALSPEERKELFWVGEQERSNQAEWEKPAPAAPFEPPDFKSSDMSGTPTWKSWFARQYPTIASEFLEKPGRERTKGTWAQYLEQERNRIKEEFSMQSPYMRGEYPSVYAPKLKTVIY